jgi:rare lipoprotein A
MRVPRGTLARFTNPHNGKSFVAKTNDSGPYVKGRIADLSPSQFRHLYGSLSRGVAPIKVEILQFPNKKTKHRKN